MIQKSRVSDSSGKDRRRGVRGRPYPRADESRHPVRRVARPRAPRLCAPACTMRVVARCDNREVYFTTPEDFELVLARLKGVRYLFGAAGRQPKSQRAAS